MVASLDGQLLLACKRCVNWGDYGLITLLSLV